MKNIKIIYILSFLNRLWFWSGIWVFYYLTFTDYAGIGFIESVMISTFIITEIPSGAIADLFGKKKTLALSFFLLILGNIIMAIAPSYGYLILSVFILSISNAFYSGTAEALVYDSLKEEKKEAYYDKIISNIKTISLIAVALASTIGGFLYNIYHPLPFYLVAIMGALGLIIATFLKEPHVDTDKFSWNNFTKQTRQGLKELTKTPSIIQQTILLLSISFFLVINYEILSDVLAVEFGFNPGQLGILWSILAIVAAISSQITPKLDKKFRLSNLYITIGFCIAASLFISPFIGLIIGGLSIVVRASFQVIFENLTSIIINNNTESKYRATTLSTFNLIKSLPYVAVAYFMGYIMNIISAKVFASGLGVLLSIFLIIQYWRNNITHNHQ